jgi:ribose transport system ATP-binding protein
VTAGDEQGDALALRIDGVSKAYPGTQALRHVSIDVRRGEIHALLGANGSGKSTLVKVLAGVVRADAGTLQIRGLTHPTAGFSPSEAHRSGLRFVHQHSSTFPELTVAENLAAGRGFETGLAGRIRWRAVNARTKEVLRRFGIDAQPGQPLSSLGPATQMMVAIARALQDQEGDDAGILVLDEPTAALPAPQVSLLLAALRRYAAAGQTILYVSHRLDAVLDLVDRVTVLRDGRLVATEAASDVSHDSLIELIVGRALAAPTMRSEAAGVGGAASMRVCGLRGGPVRDVSLSVRKGEIVGIAGLVGSGRSSLLRMLFGDLKPEAGTVEVEGHAVRIRSPGDAVRVGFAYVPEDRIQEAAFMQLTLAENLSAAMVRQYWRAGRLRHRAEREDSRELARAFGMPVGVESRPFAALSGGTQQKGVLARWIRKRPRVLLLDDPTQGVDVGARADIYALLRRAAEDGGSILIVSSDFDELPALCDRVLVLQGGRVVAEVSGPDLDGDHLHELAYARKDSDA